VILPFTSLALTEKIKQGTSSEGGESTHLEIGKNTADNQTDQRRCPSVLGLISKRLESQDRS